MPTSILSELFQNILIKILPLYGVMALGFVFGRKRPSAAEPLSFLQIYFVVPVVVLSSVASIEFNGQYLLLPIITYLICCIVAAIIFAGSKYLWRDNTPNILAYACGCANVGYYGVPVALIILPLASFGLFMMAMLGFTLFEVTIGYYLMARGNFTVWQSLQKLARLPILYAFIAGVLFSFLNLHPPSFTTDIARDFRGAYVVLGAMIIGVGLSRLSHLRLQFSLVAAAFAGKFALWPLAAALFIFVDSQFTHWFSADIHRIFLLLSIMPLPANAISYALQLDTQPDKVGALVFLSTLFALIYVPLVWSLVGL